VLADPDALRDAEVWAELRDGTPLVTAAKRGAGRIVLRTDGALKMDSNTIDGSYEIAGRSLKATPMSWRATGASIDRIGRSGARNEELARDRAEIRDSLDNLRDSRREVEKRPTRTQPEPQRIRLALRRSRP